MSEEKINRILELRKTSPFTKQSYSVTVGIKDFHRKLYDYIANIGEDDRDISVDTIYQEGIPAFQRDNDKWTMEMKIKFVENCLLGYKGEIFLYSYNDIKTGCKILDGLQRTTALLDFQEGKFKVFGDIAYDDISVLSIMNMTSYFITLRVFQFKDEIETVRFYISMNENITHSSEDIDRAKQYLNKLLNEQN